MPSGTYDLAWTSPSSHAAETQTQTAVTAAWDVNGYNKSPKSNEFYKNGTTPKDWYTNDASKQLSEWPMTAPEGTSGIGNPCPEGWRVPTYGELYALFGLNSKPAITEVGGQNGCYFNGASSASSGVFLPAAGSRHNANGNAIDRGISGKYWSSSARNKENGNNGYCLIVGGAVSMGSNPRDYGYSVRCVQK